MTAIIHVYVELLYILNPLIYCKINHKPGMTNVLLPLLYLQTIFKGIVSTLFMFFFPLLLCCERVIYTLYI